MTFPEDAVDAKQRADTLARVRLSTRVDRMPVPRPPETIMGYITRMTTATVPTMPVPCALEALCGVAHHPEVDVPDVPVRDILAALAATVGGQITEQLRTDHKTVRTYLAMACEALDDLVDAYDANHEIPAAEPSEF